MPKPKCTSRMAAALAPRAPPPSHNKGRFEVINLFANAAIAAGAGTIAAGLIAARFAGYCGRGRVAFCMSIGISTLTGPQGAVNASCTA